VEKRREGRGAFQVRRGYRVEGWGALLDAGVLKKRGGGKKRHAKSRSPGTGRIEEGPSKPEMTHMEQEVKIQGSVEVLWAERKKEE